MAEGWDPERWNPRFLQYARVHGYPDPITMINEDAKRYPGGVMTGFTLWIQARWREYRHANGLPLNAPSSREDHVAFDAWLATLPCTPHPKED